MGFFDRVKKAFDSGGIDVEVGVGKTFRWSDDVLPVDVLIKNSADEPRTVTALRLQLVEHDRENPATTRKMRGRYEGMNMWVREPFTIAPYGQHAMRVDLPLSVSGAAEELGAEETPGWVEGVSDIVSAIAELNRENEWYVLRVIPDVEGFTAKKIGSRRIRNLRMGEWGGGIFITTIGGD